MGEFLRAFPCLCVSVDTSMHRVSYLLYGSGAGEVETVVPLGLAVADDQQEVLI